MVKAGVVLLAALAAVFGVVQLRIWNDCKLGGGILVRDAYDMPATCTTTK